METGNCYFRCLSKAAVGKQDLHQEFRNQIADIMSQFKDAFEIFSPDGKTYEDHVSAIRDLGAWATQAEIYATATRYQIDVCVYTWFGRNWDWAIYKPRFHLNVVEREKMPFQRIEILHYYNHFELIVPLNPSTKLTAPGLSQARLKSSGKNLGCFFFLNSI